MQLISQARLYLSQNAQNTVDKLSWIQQTASKADSDSQYLILGYLEQGEVFPQFKSWGLLCLHAYLWSRDKSLGQIFKMKENGELVANLPWMA